MVLYHIADCPGFFVIRRPSLQTNILSHSNLDVIHIAPIPDRLENPVSEAEDQDILSSLFTQVVVNAIVLFLAEDPRYLPVEFFSRGQIVPERFFNNDARPALAATIKSSRPKLLDDLWILAGRSR